MVKVNPHKARQSQLRPKESERYTSKLLKKAEAIVSSANKIWGVYRLFFFFFFLVNANIFKERETQVELDE